MVSQLPSPRRAPKYRTKGRSRCWRPKFAAMKWLKCCKTQWSRSRAVNAWAWTPFGVRLWGWKRQKSPLLWARDSLGGNSGDNSGEGNCLSQDNGETILRCEAVRCLAGSSGGIGHLFCGSVNLRLYSEEDKRATTNLQFENGLVFFFILFYSLFISLN